MSRPLPNEYKSAFEPYISLTKGDSVGELIANHSVFLTNFFERIPVDKAGYSYAPGKWTVKEVLQHIIDMERVFAYRALVIARGEKQALPGVDHDLFADNQRVQYKAFSDIQEEYLAMTADHNILFRSFDDTALTSTGSVSGQICTCQSWIFTSFGHGLHHVELLKDRYKIVA